MLSRIAESLYWIGRYVERAEDTARILDVHLELLVDDPTTDEEDQCRALLDVMGVPVAQTATRTDVLRALAYDPDSPASIVASLKEARSSAHRARQTLSLEAWESINSGWRSVAWGQLQRMRPPSAFRLVRERCAMIFGIADGTMSRDESWQFWVLGRSIERVDMTARLISGAFYSATSPNAWESTLLATGAYHAFLRMYQGQLPERGAAKFLLLDPLFPRSVVHTLRRAESALANLDMGERRAGVQNEPAQILGRARAELEYRPLGETLALLPAQMRHLQETCSRANEAISARYFEGAVAPRWQGGAT